MKIAVLTLMLSAMATTAYFTGRIYLLMSEQHAQMVAVEQQQNDFLTNLGNPIPQPPWENKGLR